MARFKDGNWNLPTKPGNSFSLADWMYVPMSILMDLRDELKEMNRKMSSLGLNGGIQTDLRGLRRDLKSRLNRRSCRRSRKGEKTR